MLLAQSFSLARSSSNDSSDIIVDIVCLQVLLYLLPWQHWKIHQREYTVLDNFIASLHLGQKSG